MRISLQSSLGRPRFGFFCALVLFSGMLRVAYAQTKSSLTVSAAASLKDALAEVETSYKQSHANIDISNNFGPSGTLSAQIDQGAPVDVFLSAAAKPMDDLEAKGLLVAGTRRNLLRNSLVLIAPLNSTLHDFPGLTDNSVRMIALGDPASVPAGQYGRQTLLSLHLLDPIKNKFVFAKDVRQVLAYVETGNADAGLVYATDAKSSSKVRVVATAPDGSHDPIVYPVAVIKGSRYDEAAREFVIYLGTSGTRTIFAKYGFSVVN